MLSYFYNKNENILIVKVKTWNAKFVEFLFSDLIMFIDIGGNFIMDFCRNTSETELFKQALKKTYEIIPANQPYKLFRIFRYWC